MGSHPDREQRSTTRVEGGETDGLEAEEGGPRCHRTDMWEESYTWI